VGEQVRVSWQRTADGSPLGKAHSIDAAGKLVSRGARRFVEGCIIEETTITTLADLLAQAKSFGGFAHRLSGTFPPGTHGKTLRAKGAAPGATKEFLEHRPGPGVLPIDVDKSNWTTHDQVVAGLRGAVPWLGGAELLVLDSSGSCIAVDGKEERGPGGFHVYAIAEDATQIPALLEDGHRRCYLAGLGSLMLTEAATLLPRSPFDLALRVPTQPDFMVPHLGSERLSRTREPSIYEGGRIPAGAALLPVGEVARYETVLAGDRAAREPERQAKREARAVEVGTQAHRKHGGDLAAHIATAREAFDKQYLPLGFPVPLGNGETRTVAELLAAPSLAGKGWSLPDPLDPDYGPRKAQLFPADRVIHSLAHGGRRYILGAAPAGPDRLEELNREWFVLDEMGAMFVCRFVEEAFPGGQRRRVLVRYSFSDFRRKLETQPYTTGTKVSPLGDVWLRWPGRRQYDRAVFDPSSTATREGILNLWNGWAVEPRAGDWSIIRRHVEDVICGGVPECFVYLLGWIADMLQHPDHMPGVAPVLRGREGVGKSFLGAVLRRMTGQHGMLVKDSRHVVGNFNAHLRDLIFLEAGEALFAGDRRDGDRLKALITDEVVAIERKGVDAFQAPSRLHVLMTTNHDWAVPAGADSRRYFVLDVGDARRGDKAYWTRLRRPAIPRDRRATRPADPVSNRRGRVGARRDRARGAGGRERGAGGVAGFPVHPGPVCRLQPMGARPAVRDCERLQRFRRRPQGQAPPRHPTAEGRGAGTGAGLRRRDAGGLRSPGPRRGRGEPVQGAGP
jgi:hypothetical protein